MTALVSRWRAGPDPSTQFVGALLVALLVANVFANPVRFEPGNLGTTLGLAAPLMLAAMASTPAILSGAGGIDISIAPMMGLINVWLVDVIFAAGVESPLLVVPLAVGAGTLLGAINGLLVAVLRLQPIVATLGMFLVFVGLAPWVMPEPGGSVPGWVVDLSVRTSGLSLVAVGLIWWGIRRTPAYRDFMAMGGSDRAAYSAGVPVVALRVAAYALGGAIAGIAALQLTSLISSGDPNIGEPMALRAIAAAALGGVSLVGGVGGLVGAAIGALVIFLLELWLTASQISSFALQMVFGVVLVVAVVLNAVTSKARS